MIGNRMQMLEATLDLIEEGVVVLDEQSKIVYWNRAANRLTGYTAEELMGARCPEDLYCINEQHRNQVGSKAGLNEVELPLGLMGFSGAIAGYSYRTPLVDAEVESEAESVQAKSPSQLVALRHKQGHTVPAMLRRVKLSDANCRPTGAALLFFAVEEVDALPHGESGEGVGLERSQAEMEDRLEAAHHQWLTNQMPLGLLWILVDQAASLRKTHGRDACESMLRVVEQTLMRQMNPAEILGRWGNDEYLVLAHERTPELLNRARQAMQASIHEGGNIVTEARGN